ELTSLKARALKAYATKDFPQSADLYAQACTLQTEIHGEDNPTNAHLLYLYGRSLYKVAIQKSDVLGGAAPEEKEKPTEASGSGSAKGKGKGKETEEHTEGEKKPAGLFQFTGDEAYDDEEDDDDEEAEGEEGEEEEDDEMSLAWDVLDLARVLFEKQLAPTTSDASTSASVPPTLSAQQITDTKTMLSDVFDLLGEVSLESENFPQATKDFDSALVLKHELYPLESTLISEAEFKMALALEFSAQEPDLSDEDAQKLRDAAATHIEKSIDSCRARITVEEAKITDNPDKNHAKEAKEIENVKDMIVELEQRLHDLRNPPVEEAEGNEALQGLLGQILGGDQDPLLAKEALEKAMKGANDLTTLVRKKPAPAPAAGAESSGSNS
ncbi:hypothetical protein BZA05DRAFT_322844, partial [Tricharina praecox]|uniref:uncharacterized protein n=1 Tax=Tricharina praecox TaxID=43433 RepID=UPI00221E6341